ncbi:MAG: hypothetical protein HUJ76_07225 [Parasporobacterium sp.]|nr:hypothetical protein [Parasporobacterium sp.]
MDRISEFINALTSLGDGRHHYWDGHTGIGCSDYVRMALGLAGVITTAEAQNSNSLWAGQSIRGVLNDTKRFKRLDPSARKLNGDILWYHGHHVAVYHNGGIFEAAPEASHYLSSNGKTAVGYFPGYHNCSGGSLTDIYRIIDTDTSVGRKMKGSELADLAYDVAMGKYGATAYRGGSDSYRGNVGEWYNGRWHFDCLGFVHTLTATPDHFTGDKTLLGGGATMGDWVSMTDEAKTLMSCSKRGKFAKGISLNEGSLLQNGGHVGIYIGGKAVKSANGDIDMYNTAECTAIWGGGVLLSWTDLDTGKRYNKKGGSEGTAWTAWGEFSQIDYFMPIPKPTPIPAPVETALDAATALEIALEVIAGKWGNGETRKTRLTEKYGAKGYRKVQDIVNRAFGE